VINVTAIIKHIITTYTKHSGWRRHSCDLCVGEKPECL